MLEKIRTFAQLNVDSLPKVTPTASDSNGTLDTVFNLAIGILAAIAVLIIVLAGFKYVTSAGDPQGVASARKAIVYAVVGLVVCALAWAMVRFVIRGV